MNWSNVEWKNLPKVLTPEHRIGILVLVVESPKLYPWAIALYEVGLEGGRRQGWERKGEYEKRGRERGGEERERRETWRDREAEWMKQQYHHNRTVHSGMCTHSIRTSQSCFKFLPCKTIADCLCGFALSSNHPLKQADCDRSAPDRLEAAQLEVGSSWPLGLQWSLQPLETPCVSEHMPSYSGLITHNYMSPLLFLLLTSRTEVSSPGRTPGQVYGDPEVPNHQSPLLGLVDVFQRRAEQEVWHRLGCKDCRKNTKVSIQSP